MADDVRLDIVLTDDGEPARRPELPWRDVRSTFGPDLSGREEGGQDTREALKRLADEAEERRREREAEDVRRRLAQLSEGSSSRWADREPPRAEGRHRAEDAGRRFRGPDADAAGGEGGPGGGRLEEFADRYARETLGAIAGLVGKVNEPDAPEGADAGTEEQRGKWVERLQGVEQFADRLAKIAAPAAGNDLLGTLRASAGEAAVGLSILGERGQAVGQGLLAVSGTIDSFGQIVTSFVERGKQLAAYSPELAQAGAMAELTSVLADMREADALGEELGALTSANAELIAFLRDALLPLKKWLLSTLGPLVETFTATLQNIYIIGQNVYTVLGPFLELVGSGISGILGLLGQLASLVDEGLGFARARKERFGEDAASRAFDDIIDAVKDLAAVPLGPLDRPDAVLGVP